MSSSFAVMYEYFGNHVIPYLIFILSIPWAFKENHIRSLIYLNYVHYLSDVLVYDATCVLLLKQKESWRKDLKATRTSTPTIKSHPSESKLLVRGVPEPFPFLKMSSISIAIQRSQHLAYPVPEDPISPS